MAVLDQFRLDGRVVLVTGAGSGLGRAMAEAVGEAGASVVVGDIDGQRAEATAAAVRERGAEALAVAADVARAADAERLVAAAVERFGRLDVLFNNAGVTSVPTRAHELSEEEWQRIIGIDLTAVFLVARAALRTMLRQGGGKIINTASIWGLVGSDMHPVPAYAAAKGGVANFTRELAAEYAREGITANAIAPGFFLTNLSPRMRDPEYAVRYGGRTLLGRVAQTEEVKGLAVFLASAASNYITGQVIPIDGGVTAT